MNSPRDLGMMLLFLLAMAAGISSARAETIAATSTAGTGSANIGYRWYGDFLSTDYGSWQLAATATQNHPELHGTGYYVLTQSTTQVYIAITGRGSGYGEYNAYLYRRSTCMTGYTLSGGLCYPPPTLSCPAGQNWTLSGSNCTRTDCVAPQVRNVSTGVCQAPPCTSKAAVAPDAFYDYGTDPSGVFPSVVCASGCLAIFSGTSPAGSAIVAGVKHYYAFGGYDFAGSGTSSSCTVGASTPAPSASVAAIPPSHCAPDQIEGLINGKLNCWNVPAPGEAPTVAPTDAAVTSTTTASTTTETVGDTTTTTNITNNAGGGTTTVQTVCTGANCTTTTTESKPAEDPAEGLPSSGTLATVDDLADDDSRTFGSVWTERKNQLMATPLVGLASSLTSFPGGVGACPSWSVGGTVFGTTIGGDLSPPCWLWGVFRAILLLTSLFVARRLIFGG